MWDERVRRFIGLSFPLFRRRRAGRASEYGTLGSIARSGLVNCP